MYGNDILSINPYAESNDKSQEYIKAARDDMSAFLGRDVMDTPRIKNFFLMKDTTKIPSNEETRYMRINYIDENGFKCYEYQNRVKNLQKLPTVSDVVEGKARGVLNKSKQNTSNNNNNRTGGQNKGFNGGYKHYNGNSGKKW
jgi:hypothetical protein